MAHRLGLARRVASSATWRGSTGASTSIGASTSSTSFTASFSTGSPGSSDEAPLAHEWIEPPGDHHADAPVALVLHGLMGSGRNWRTFTRALSAQLARGGTPWRFALVDHVWHGHTFGDAKHRERRNPSRETLTNGACAVDLAARAIGDFATHVRATQGGARVAAVLGHSLGGKIALKHLARLHLDDSLPNHPTQWWSLDSVPSAVSATTDPHGVQRVIDAIRSLPKTFASREELTEKLLSLPGAFPKDLIDWLGTNLAPVHPHEGVNSRLTWMFDPDGVAALYASYKRDDGALRVALDPPQRDGSSACEVHVVRAERSTRWPAETESALVKRSETAGSRLRYHVLPNAGHWLHVDNPVGLRDVIAPELARLHASLP